MSPLRKEEITMLDPEMVENDEALRDRLVELFDDRHAIDVDSLTEEEKALYEEDRQAGPLLREK
jgi:hypothetical protein